MIARDGFVQVEGRRIHYLEAGEGQPLVLLHSGGGSAYEFEHVIAPLSEHHRVIAWDMPGHGDSDPLLRHMTIAGHDEALAGLIAALGLADVILAGVSIGGYIAMHHAVTRPAGLSRVVLAEAPLRDSAWYDANWPMFEAMCAIPDTPFDALAKRIRALTPDLHRRWNIDRNKCGSWTLVDLGWAVRDFDAAGTYAAGSVPATVVIGGNGPTLADRAKFEALRPDAALIVLPGCGHFPMLDDPAAFVEAVLRGAADGEGATD
ncbi:alpha/beta hydrolase [Sphingomonas naphthae]|uniref:Alpha/beta hydrolase n=1 Tax=Sphingomonas naphthae TaxID=1813468 RepID=A0ABY7TQM0_9SPHN|nr:alpha/beta hydrolase [Sphingomonas naphthae]WCT74474.1 alpha/beta hydrolase [Sphingomonas naphthae]